MELTQQILKYWGESEDLDDLAIAVPVDDLFTAIVGLSFTHRISPRR
jgi:hypothetical protein